MHQQARPIPDLPTPPSSTVRSSPRTAERLGHRPPFLLSVTQQGYRRSPCASSALIPDVTDERINHFDPSVRHHNLLDKIGVQPSTMPYVISHWFRPPMGSSGMRDQHPTSVALKATYPSFLVKSLTSDKLLGPNRVDLPNSGPGMPLYAYSTLLAVPPRETHISTKHSE